MSIEILVSTVEDPHHRGVQGCAHHPLQGHAGDFSHHVSGVATGAALWLLFRFLINNLPIIVSNAITLGLALTIIAMKLKYK
jgi:hypothetical protein